MVKKEKRMGKSQKGRQKRGEEIPGREREIQDRKENTVEIYV
jgi:hypothetical protein